MIKKLCTLLLLATLSAPLLAQTASSNGEGVIFAPQKGQWQVSMFLGGGNKFYNENTTYLDDGRILDFTVQVYNSPHYRLEYVRR